MGKVLEKFEKRKSLKKNLKILSKLRIFFNIDLVRGKCKRNLSYINKFHKKLFFNLKSLKNSGFQVI